MSYSLKAPKTMTGAGVVPTEGQDVDKRWRVGVATGHEFYRKQVAK